MSLSTWKEVVAASKRMTVHRPNGEPHIIKSPRYGYQTLYFSDPLAMYVAAIDPVQAPDWRWVRHRVVSWSRCPSADPALLWMPEVHPACVLIARWVQPLASEIMLIDEAEALCAMFAAEAGEGPIRVEGDPPLLFAGEPDWAYFGVR